MWIFNKICGTFLVGADEIGQVSGANRRTGKGDWGFTRRGNFCFTCYPDYFIWYTVVQVWPWLSWRRKSKLPNDPPIEHCEAIGNKRAQTFGKDQSMEDFFNNFIDWLKWVVIQVTRTIALTGIGTLDLEMWNLKWDWYCHCPMTAHCFTQCSNGCSLGSLLFPRQYHRL